MSFGDLLEQSLSEDKVREGEVVDGTVVAVHRDHVIVDFGFKSEGMVDIQEFPEVEGKRRVGEGDVIKVLGRLQGR